MLTAVRQKGGGTDNKPGGNDAFSAAPLLNVQLRNIVLLTPESRALPQQHLQFVCDIWAHCKNKESPDFCF